MYARPSALDAYAYANQHLWTSLLNEAKMEDGWIRYQGKEILFYAPEGDRDTLWRPSDLAVIPVKTGPFTLDLSRLQTGREWLQYKPEQVDDDDDDEIR